VRVITLKIPEPLLEKLDLYCRENNLTRSEAIRQAISRMLGYDYKESRVGREIGFVKCPVCGKYYSVNSIVYHIADIHSDIALKLAEKYITRAGDKLRCLLCGKIFTGINGLIHIAKHIMEAPEKLLKEG